jgi:hypothetical protein
MFVACLALLVGLRYFWLLLASHARKSYIDNIIYAQIFIHMVQRVMGYYKQNIRIASMWLITFVQEICFLKSERVCLITLFRRYFLCFGWKSVLIWHKSECCFEFFCVESTYLSLFWFIWVEMKKERESGLANTLRYHSKPWN